MKDTLSHKRIPLIILGAGFAGLGASIEAKRKGISSLTLDAGNEVGGLCRNTVVSGCDFDFGPKILILDESENSKEILGFLGNNYGRYPMKESVYLDDFGLLGFPLQRHLIDLPKHERGIILSEINKLSSERPIRSYKDWLISRYGEYLSNRVLIPYEEKKWQVSLDELDYNWALSRPVSVSNSDIIKGSQKKLPPNKFYYYPKTGNISTLSKKMAEAAGPILLNHTVQKVDPINRYVIAAGKTYYYNKLVSTIPLDSLLRSIGHTDEVVIDTTVANTFKYLSIRVYNIVFGGNHSLEGTAIYFPEKKYTFRRVSVLQNLCPALARPGLTPISVEVSLNKLNRQLSTQEMGRKILQELASIPQFRLLGKPITFDVLDIEFAYPLQTNGLRNLVNAAHGQLKNYDIYCCGRGGNFDYCNSDEAYKQGKETVAELYL